MFTLVSMGNLWHDMLAVLANVTSLVAVLAEGLVKAAALMSAFWGRSRKACSVHLANEAAS